MEAGIAWSIENLTVAERNAVREAVGQPPVGEPLTPDVWNLQPGYVPSLMPR